MNTDAYDEERFSYDVILNWADCCEYLFGDANLLHPQMTWLAYICETFPERRIEVLEFLNDLMCKPGVISEIRNAIAISFLDLEQLQAYDLDRSKFVHVFTINEGQ